MDFKYICTFIFPHSDQPASPLGVSGHFIVQNFILGFHQCSFWLLFDSWLEHKLLTYGLLASNHVLFKITFIPLWKTRANTSCKTCKTFLRFVSPLTVPSTEEILLSASLNLCILSHHVRQEEKQKQGDRQSKNANNGIAEVTFSSFLYNTIYNRNFKAKSEVSSGKSDYGVSCEHGK